MTHVKDQNGETHWQAISHEPEGWGVTVWFGGAMGPATEIRRYYYVTREQARQGDISHTIGSHGRIA